jgi:hypothetical protein
LCRRHRDDQPDEQENSYRTNDHATTACYDAKSGHEPVLPRDARRVVVDLRVPAAHVTWQG